MIGEESELPGAYRPSRLKWPEVDLMSVFDCENGVLDDRCAEKKERERKTVIIAAIRTFGLINAAMAYGQTWHTFGRELD